MELTLFIVVMSILVTAFIVSQLVAILFLLKRNDELQEQIEDNDPPF